MQMLLFLSKRDQSVIRYSLPIVRKNYFLLLAVCFVYMYVWVCVSFCFKNHLAWCVFLDTHKCACVNFNTVHTHNFGWLWFARNNKIYFLREWQIKQRISLNRSIDEHSRVVSNVCVLRRYRKQVPFLFIFNFAVNGEYRSFLFCLK